MYRIILCIIVLILGRVFDSDRIATAVSRTATFYLFLSILSIVVVFLFKRRRLAPVKPSPISYALVTGASAGIGQSIAEELAKWGFNVILVARNETNLRSVAARLTRYHIDTKIIVHDLAAPNAAQLLWDKIQAMEPAIHVDILVNNAGIGVMDTFLSADAAKYQELLQLNVVAVTQLCSLFTPAMIARRRGRIAILSSISALWPNGRAAVYGASKAYLHSFAQALDFELRGTGVGVTSILPGPTHSTFATRAGGESALVFQLPGGVMTSAQVARAGVAALIKGDQSIITGIMNKINVFAVWFVPRPLSDFGVYFLWGNGQL